MNNNQLPKFRRAVLLLGATIALALTITGCGPAASAGSIVQVTPIAPQTGSSADAVADDTAAIEAVDESAAPVAVSEPLTFKVDAESPIGQMWFNDLEMKPEVENLVTFDSFPVAMTFDDFYSGYDMRKGVVMSDELLSLDGKRVTMEGYMAPPLKLDLDWFVLTRVPLEFCPFCSSDAEWPLDIAVVYMTDETLTATQIPIRVNGQIEIGSAVDPETGMVSLVRIYAEEVELLQ